MKTLIFSGIIISSLGFVACQSNGTTGSKAQDSLAAAPTTVDTIHTSQNSLDWQGSYEGVTPCADCPGIKTRVELNADETFSYEAEYLDRDFTATDSGKFMWHDNGSVIHIKGKETDLRFKVGENQLIQLDQSGEQITGQLADLYILKKTR